MLTSQHLWPERLKSLENGVCTNTVRVVVHWLPELFAWRENIVFSDSRSFPATMRKEIAAKQGLCHLVEEHTAVLAMRYVRRVHPTQSAVADLEQLAIFESSPRSAREIVH